MKPRSITNLQLASWVVSWFIATWSALCVFAADPAPADPAPADPPPTEKPKEKAKEKTEEKPKDTSDPTVNPDPTVPPEPPAPPSPIDDFAALTPTPEIPLSEHPGGALKEDVPDTLPLSIPLEGAVPFSTTDAENEDTVKPDDNLTVPWTATPDGYFGQAGSQYGNAFGAAPPSGFSSATPTYPMGGGMASLRDGFQLATTFTTTYNSNITSSPGGSIAPILDDFIFSLGGSLNYMSTAKEWTFGGSYTGSYNQYLDQTDYSGYSQGLRLVGIYNGSKLDATFTLNGNYDQGTNRYYSSDYVQQISINSGLSLRYQLSPKTTLQGNIGQNYTTTTGDNYNDTESFNLGLAALWKYSALTELGPGIRYTSDVSGSQGGRTSIGPELLVNYKLAAKVSLNSRVGIAFSQYEDGGSSDPAFTGSIGLNYNASRLWGMNLSLYSGTQANASTSDVFTQVNSLRVGYHRKMRRATLNLGLGYEIDTSQSSDNNTSSAYPDRNYFNMNASLGMPIFHNTCYGSVFVQYNDQSSNSETQAWETTQAGFSINRSF